MTPLCRKAFPDIEVISEEHGEVPVDLTSLPKPDIHNPEVEKLEGYDVPAEEIAVWIDPLDATQVPASAPALAPAPAPALALAPAPALAPAHAHAHAHIIFIQIFIYIRPQ